MEHDMFFAEAIDGTIFFMTAEVSIYLSRLLGVAGADALFNRLTPHGGDPVAPTAMT